jgi:hypothetical protein
MRFDRLLTHFSVESFPTFLSSEKFKQFRGFKLLTEAGKLKVRRPDEKEIKLGGLHLMNRKVKARKTESVVLIDKVTRG